jgi:hypothetical protein
MTGKPYTVSQNLYPRKGGFACLCKGRVHRVVFLVLVDGAGRLKGDAKEGRLQCVLAVKNHLDGEVSPPVHCSQRLHPQPPESKAKTSTCVLSLGVQTHDGGRHTSRSGVGFSLARSRWSRALGRETYGGFVVGEDGQGLLRALYRQVRRLLARRAASQTLMVGSDTRHSTPVPGVHSTTEGHLECTCCAEGGSDLRVG